VKTVFFGTSVFAARILKFLVEKGIDIVAVVTRPDKPQGRSQNLLPPPVKEMAISLNPPPPVFQPVKASDPEFARALQALAPDLFIVAVYGQMVKQNLLDMPKYGCINVHPSLLPKYRGAAPIRRCLMNGDRETGVTIMKMILEMDAGDILEVVRMPVPETMTHGELDDKLCELSGPALLTVIDRIASGTVRSIPQDHAAATFAPKLSPGEEAIDWSRPARELHNQIRALSPSPCAYAWVQVGNERKRLKVKRSEVVPILTQERIEPGTALPAGKFEWIVACGGGALKLLEVQLEGKKAMAVPDFLRGLQAAPKILLDKI